jgi:hypothetical protein
MILTGTGIIRGVGNSVSYNVVALVPGSIFVDPTASPILTNDGVNWLTTTSSSTPTIWQVNSILYSIGYSKFVICAGKTGKCGWSYSSDGRSWTKSSTVTTREQLSLIEGNNKTPPIIYKLISLANGYVRYSTDGGVTWSAETAYGISHTPVAGGGCFNELSGLYISAGSGTNRVMYSADGSNWTGVTVGTQNFVGNVYFSGSSPAPRKSMIVASGSMYYGDGVTWTAGTLSGDSASISTIAYSPTLNRAIATTNTTTGYVSSGVTQLVGIASLFPVTFTRIIWSTALSKFIGFASTSSSAVYTSSTGLAGSWTNVYAMNDINRSYSRAASK